ncbi:putative virion structural protein [Ralstonia phage RP31]|uniref:Putative virion structural protein n=1 Tax=Ralstonia phage RP31 TaxID=1923890 RepID=A0A1L7N227_9CAUD|nr:putative virion structural protein [Ralstonia phage RP31]
MYSTKSFCEVFAFASNEPGVISPIGELTTFAETFTKELGIYHHSSLDGYDLMNFSSVQDGVKKSMSPVNVDQAVALVDQVVKATLSTSGELFYDEVLLALKTKADSLNVTSVNMGAMVSDGTHWVPEWISWVDANTGAGDNQHKVWLALDSFKNQYTDYDIVVVPPFDNLDIFFNPGSIVESNVQAITPTQMMERADAAKAGNPETVLRTDPYEYRDPVNTSRRFDVYWTVLIYGAAGNDPDIIRDALVTYILANSTHGRDEWATIFPDIFKRTEFIFAPFWLSYAAEQRVFDYGIYSPIVDNANPVAWLTNEAYGYTVDQIKAVSQVMGFPYRSMQMAVVGHIENRDGKMKITDYYPDFINVGTESTDFGRMSLPTQQWASVMMDLIKTAEAMNDSTDMPRGMYRVVRGNKTYVGKSYNRLLLLVLAKYSS